ncbi:hypothetical protein ACTXG6_06560 [Pseudonocardia sp. Cha107L01]|uniref:hypothetical protein n=1 Tax=Pseudonocardia sp. Cha107L01 TaxID=3457576 RepID=UPI00403E9187
MPKPTRVGKFGEYLVDEAGGIVWIWEDGNWVEGLDPIFASPDVEVLRRLEDPQDEVDDE